LALVVFAIACFGVIAGQGDSGSVKQPAEKAAGAGAAAPVVKTTRTTYRVKAGDSFALIAEKTGVSAEQLQTLNPEIDPRALQPGQKLKLK
jgi:LysM repeat protein